MDNLKNDRHVSKLDIANYLTSHRITKLAELNKEYLSRSHELSRTVWFDLLIYAKYACTCNGYVGRIPLMQAFYAKLYDYYKSATDSERTATEGYFGLGDFRSRVPRLIGSKMIRLTCDKLSSIPPPLYLNNISLQNLTSFIKGLKTYLEKTRLNGHFFRYVVVICTLCLQRWRIVTGSTPRSRAVPVSLNR